MKKLNKDQIKLLRLLADAYNFANYADCPTDTDYKYIDKGNYININNINKLDYKYTRRLISKTLLDMMEISLNIVDKVYLIRKN